MVSTVTRSPRRQGFPSMTCGSSVIRSSLSSVISPFLSTDYSIRGPRSRLPVPPQTDRLGEFSGVRFFAREDPDAQTPRRFAWNPARGYQPRQKFPRRPVRNSISGGGGGSWNRTNGP